MLKTPPLASPLKDLGKSRHNQFQQHQHQQDQHQHQHQHPQLHHHPRHPRHRKRKRNISNVEHLNGEDGGDSDVHDNDGRGGHVDEENHPTSSSKSLTKVNSVSSPLKKHDDLLNGGRKHKKARHAYINGGKTGVPMNGLNGFAADVNHAGPSSLGSFGSGIKFSALQEQRMQLPIAKGREAILEEIRKNEVTVLIGETGSGKTTQVPQYLLESGICGNGIIAVTQPRRVAATSLASRVALEQNGSSVGHIVGYSVRFDEKSGPETRIKYMTDGMIVRELLSDPLLSRYSVIIVDEAHERSLRTDLLLASLKTILKTRRTVGRGGGNDGKGKAKEEGLPPLKVVVMSATMDAEKFSRFFNYAKILYVKGRQHPVKIYHCAEGQPDYVDAAMRTFFQIHTDQPPGDVLIFLPGQEDIESLEKSIQLFVNRLPQDKMQVVTTPMFAAQAPGANAKVFAPTPQGIRKCILATNIAETSITIPGVKYVIDTGKCKEKRFLARETGGGFDTLLTRDITKSSAMQRAGRAGREGPGFCFRLYTEESFTNMAAAAEPEIMRVSLSQSILQLKCLDQDIEDLDLMDKPDRDSIISAFKTLWLLSALDNSKRLTKIGSQMALFPLDPPHARSLLASREHGCTAQVLTIISVLNASSKLFIDVSEQRESAVESRRAFVNARGDHLTVLNVARAYEDVCRGHEVAHRTGEVEGEDWYVEKKKGKGRAKAERREWCRKYWLNERTLIEAREIRKQLEGVCERFGWRGNLRDCGSNNTNSSSEKEEESVLLSLGSGLVQNSAFLQPDGSYKQTMGRSVVKIHPGSVLAEKKVPAIVYDELVYTNQIYARGVSAIPRHFFTSYSALNQRRA